MSIILSLLLLSAIIIIITSYTFLIYSNYSLENITFILVLLLILLIDSRVIYII